MAYNETDRFHVIPDCVDPSSLIWVDQPISERRYPENPSAKVKRLPELVKAGDSSYVGADDEPMHGIAVYKGYNAVDFEEDLVLYVVVEPAPKGREWRKESKHVASYTFRLEQPSAMGNDRFYAPAEVKVDARLLDGEKHVVVIMTLKPRNPMRSVACLGDGRLELSVTDDEYIPYMGRRREQGEAFQMEVAMDPQFYLGALMSADWYLVMLNGVPNSGKTTTLSMVQSLLHDVGCFHWYGRGGDRHDKCDGATRDSKVFEIMTKKRETFFYRRDVSMPGQRRFIDVAGFDLHEMTDALGPIFEHGLALDLDMAVPENRRPKAIETAAATGKTTQRTFMPEYSVIFMKAQDIISALGEKKSEEERMGRGSCPPEKVRDFNMDFQKATKRRATIVITKLDEIMEGEDGSLGILSAPAGSARAEFVEKAKELLKVSGDEIILASLRPDHDGPEAVPSTAKYFRVGVAALWIMSRGIDRAIKGVLNDVHEEISSKATYSKPVHKRGKYADIVLGSDEEQDEDGQEVVFKGQDRPNQLNGKRKTRDEDDEDERDGGEKQVEDAKRPKSLTETIMSSVQGLRSWFGVQAGEPSRR